MNRRPDLSPLLIPVDLAREPDFTVGALQVSPSRRQVMGGSISETVQPRVMQVLVALFRAKGAVVSREDLIESCWEGIVVGDDAINRCIAKVRGLADLGGPSSFKVETIPRVGYRLIARAPDAQLLNPQSETDVVRAASSGEALPRRPAARASSRWIAVAAALAVALVTVWRLLAPSHAAEWTVVESHMPFIGTSQVERHPALSPDGTMLAYSAGPTVTHRQIFLRIIKADSSIQLTHETYDAMSPAWSPDGSTIAYSVFQGGKPCKLMAMQIPSGEPYQIGGCRTAQRAFLTFAPGGRDVVFNDADVMGSPERLVQMNLQTGRVTPLTTPKTGLNDRSPTFSPDGRYFAYIRNTDGIHGEVRLRRMSDGFERMVAFADPWDCSVWPAWTPDSTSLLLPGNCHTNAPLGLYPVEGGKPSRLLVGSGSIGKITVSANGYVAMEVASGHTQLLAFKVHAHDPPVPLDEGSGLVSWCVDVAPDGALAITGRKGNALGIWTADKEGAPFRKLMSLPDQACSIRWSPDGTVFAFLQDRSDGFDMPVVSRTGEVLRRFHFSAIDSGLLAWAADGRSIYTSRREARGFRIWQTDLSHLKSIPVTPFGWTDPGVYRSILLAEKAGSGGVWRMDRPTPERMTEGPVPDSEYLFTVSGGRIYSADETDPKHPAIAAQNVSGGPKERLIDLPYGLTGYPMGVNPKTGDIVLSVGAQEDTDIALIRLKRVAP